MLNFVFKKFIAPKYHPYGTFFGAFYMIFYHFKSLTGFSNPLINHHQNHQTDYQTAGHHQDLCRRN